MKGRALALHDPIFLIIVTLLVGGGLFLLSSASVALSLRMYGDSFYITLRQGLSVLLGLLGFFVLQAVPYRFWQKAALPIAIASFLLLGLVFAPHLGVKLHGAHRWINLGFFTFQPSEVAKFGLVLLLSWWFSRGDRTSSWKYGFLPFLGIIGVVAALMMAEPDMGTFGVMVGTAFLMYFAAGGKIKELLIIAGIGIVALLFLAKLEPYRVDRLTVFLHPETDPQGIGYQARQATIAIGSGGFWGVGYGASREKRDVIPEPVGDSIFAIIGEEFGFAGSVAILCLYLLFFWRSLWIAKRAPDNFSRLLVIGIGATIAFQAFVHIGAISGILPLTGIPLPFISYGGTAVIIMLSELGVIYQVAKHS